MRAYMGKMGGGIDSLRVVALPNPAAPSAGQVRVALRAASLNYRDLIVLDGRSAFAGALHAEGPGYIPLSDGAGEVVEVGESVWRVKPGDRVALTFNPQWIAGAWAPSPGTGGRGAQLPGVLCEEVVVGQDELVVLPDYLTFEEAACLPCAAVTAWSALCAPAPLLPGDAVLVQGTGGVSLFALQFSLLFGTQVIATSSSPAKLERLTALGAHATIDYVARPAWQEGVLEATNGRGVDVVVEVGGGGTMAQSIAATRQGGRIAIVGLLAGLPNASDGAFIRGLTTSIIRVGSRADFVAMLRAMTLHETHPVIDRVFSFDEAPAALRLLKDRGHVGKIVLRID